MLCGDNTLQFLPVSELEQLRKDEQVQRNVTLEAENPLLFREGSVYEAKLKINLKESTAKKICMELRSSDEKKTLVVFDFEKAEISFDRSRADGWSKGIAKSPLNLLERTTWISIYSQIRVR